MSSKRTCKYLPSTLGDQKKFHRFKSAQLKIIDRRREEKKYFLLFYLKDVIY